MSEKIIWTYELSASPTMTVSLEKQCAWNMDAHRGRSLVAFGYSGECHIYHIKRQIKLHGLIWKLFF